MRLTFSKGIALGLVVASAALSTTSALAGTGIGAVFNLGTANRVNAATSLSGSVSGPALKLTNSGTGTALGLHVGKGKAPLTVNSATQVANLNASLLDGMAATGFVHGGGQARAFGFTLTGTQHDVKLLSVPGYGELTADCVAGTGADVFYFNLSNSAQDAWISRTNASLGPFEITLAPFDGIRVLDPSAGTQRADLMVHYTSASGRLVFQHVATAGVLDDSSSAACQFVAETVAGPASLLP
jgi:hypothetical protein